jgi:hypothetical protein
MMYLYTRSDQRTMTGQLDFFSEKERKGGLSERKRGNATGIYTGYVQVTP